MRSPAVALAPVVLAALAAAAPAVPAPAVPAAGELETLPVPYRDGDATLEGHLAWDGARPGPRPVVLVVHEWWGLGDHARRSAERMAALGYLGFAVDMYGKGMLTKDGKQAGEWSGALRKDPAAVERRLRAALAALKDRPEADLGRVACIGFCFGGTVSLEAAWAGLDLRAVVSFHGNPTAPPAGKAKGVKASILVLHGADDPFVPRETIDGFEAAMKEHGLDWAFVSLGGAVHSFTNPEADGSFSAGAKYHAVAARRSWAFAEGFLEERLK
jgi:dienelactone hydrolase